MEFLFKNVISNINEVIRAVLNLYFFYTKFSNAQKHQSSNINEVSRAVLNSVFFFNKSISNAPKAAKKHQEAQKRNQAKTQKRK